ncbi:MAG: AAA family ATPase [Deltaproteobacteria bacterium]|nr:AAA family ATPase [Deltaproteobacteria bacterium]
MPYTHNIVFQTFRLDPTDERLWCGTQEIPLRPKTFSVLRFLLEHPGRLITKEELLDAVWPNTSVSDVVLLVCIRELRKALGDQVEAPQFIATVPRRGYRFIAPLTGESPAQSPTTAAPASPRLPIPRLIGRGTELKQLHRWLQKATTGERQVILVSGEDGIGKTALIETFLQQAETTATFRVWRGQCIEHHGTGEAYLPVLDALGRLCRQSESRAILALLQQHAPTWLLQLPGFLHQIDQEALQRRVPGITRERMLREMAEFLDALSTVAGTDTTLVLWLEDLHWSDASTLDLFSFLARRQEPARFLFIGTYRPAEALHQEHPLLKVKQELRLHRFCEELRLGFLTATEVEDYVAMRLFPEAPTPGHLREFAQAIHRRTEGNPLFMADVVNSMLVHSEGDISAVSPQTLADTQLSIPETLQQTIDQRVEQLHGEAQQILEVASIAGVTFSAAAVAAGLDADVVEVERVCRSLARQERFLRMDGVSEWPDGTVATRFTFIHALYPEVLAQRLTEAQRTRLHRRIGEREEAAYGDQAGEIATELATLFERGREYARAVRYLQIAARKSIQRGGYREAVLLTARGLKLFAHLPKTEEYGRQELAMQMRFATGLRVTQGALAPETVASYRHAQDLCSQLGESSQPLWALTGIFDFHFFRGEFHAASELGLCSLAYAQKTQNSAQLVWAYAELGLSAFRLGELSAARHSLQQALALYDPQRHFPSIGAACASYHALALWLLGHSDQATVGIRRALTLAEDSAHPYSRAYAYYYAAVFHYLRQETREALQHVETGISIAVQYGFPEWEQQGTVLRGSIFSAQGNLTQGIALMDEGLAVLKTMGAEGVRSYAMGWQAMAYGQIGQPEKGLAIVEEALLLAREGGQQILEAELLRQKGELLLLHSTALSCSGERGRDAPAGRLYKKP